jgi:LmbE family N-acetylglucosaminyl deacetylase
MNVRTMAHLVFSPHPDDAVWSVGGRIARWAGAGHGVTVVTVFDGSADIPPGPWRQVAAPATRRAEDISAVACLGAERVSLALPEAALRADRGVPRYANLLSVFGPVCERDRTLPVAIADAALETLGPGTVLHAPLAAGRHVDHRLVRAAAAALAARGAEVRYYEDFPYRLRPSDHAGLLPDHSPVDMVRWLRAAGCYHSQVNALFKSESSFRSTLISRSRECGREVDAKYADRFWAHPHGALASFDL